MERFDHLNTEKYDIALPFFENVTDLEFVETMNMQNKEIYAAIEKEKDEIASLINSAHKHYMRGGNIIYVGAGNSGRIANLDALDCSIFFGVTNRFKTIIAGGKDAYITNINNAEDHVVNGEKDLKDNDISNRDFVIGISASGRTTYVIGALNYAHNIGATTACICCNKQTAIGGMVDYSIELDCGSEMLIGVTKLKSTSAQKIILNTISTSILIKSGRTYKNLTPYLVAHNEKFYDRSIRIIMEICDVKLVDATSYYERSHYNCAAAILMCKHKITLEHAKDLLKQQNDFKVLLESIEQ